MTNLKTNGFIGKTILERIDYKHYMLHEELSFKGSRYQVTLKPGFITDGASIPEIFWTLIGCPFRGRYVGSAIIHDGLYGTHFLPKKECDILFEEMMDHNGVPFIRKKVIYYGVHLFGWHAYYKKSKNLIESNRKLVKVEKVK